MNIREKINFIEDFESDIENIYKKYLIKENLTYKNNQSYFYQYMNFLERYIIPKPRKVLESSNLKMSNDIEIQGYVKLKEKINKGEDINQYQSKKLDNPFYIDELFNFEGLVHLHLGNSIEDKKSKNRSYIDRTENLAIAIINDERAYILCIEPHGKDTWINEKYFKILRHEFPELFKEQAIGEISLDDIKKCRNLGISYNKIPMILGTQIRAKHIVIKDKLHDYISIKSEEIKDDIKKREKNGNFKICLKEMLSERNGYPKEMTFEIFKDGKQYGEYEIK